MMQTSLRFKPTKLSELTKFIGLFFLGLISAIALIQAAQAAGSNSVGSVATGSNQGLAPYATIALFIGGVFLVLYVRAIYLVLTYAAKTYAIEVDFSSSPKYNTALANKIIGLGSVLLVIGSALIISSYGWGPWFLFTGPTICLLCSTVILVSMEIDIRKYRKILIANKQIPKLRVFN